MTRFVVQDFGIDVELTVPPDHPRAPGSDVVIVSVPPRRQMQLMEALDITWVTASPFGGFVPIDQTRVPSLEELVLPRIADIEALAKPRNRHERRRLKVGR